MSVEVKTTYYHILNLYGRGSYFTASPLDAGKISKIRHTIRTTARPYFNSFPHGTYTENSRVYKKEMCMAIMKSCAYSLSALRARMGFSLQPQLSVHIFISNPKTLKLMARNYRVGRVLSAYYDDKAYSVELVGAVSLLARSLEVLTVALTDWILLWKVLRQGSFVRKMYDLGWTSPGYFDSTEDELALHHASARYHAYVDH